MLVERKKTHVEELSVEEDRDMSKENEHQEEEDNENGGAPPLLFTPDELQSAVSTGTGDVEGFDAVDKVIGEENPNLNWFGEIPQLHGRYGRAHVKDYYGFGSQSYGDTYISNNKGSSK